MVLTEAENDERERLLQLQANHQRWFSQEEWDELQRLSKKKFEDAGDPCKEK